MQDITSPMTSLERRATLSLASIYALRMLGLFMLLPVLSLFAEQISGSTPLLMGLAISIYGLSQALLQIPFGLLSDRFGRKKIIIIGLILFIAGSVVAALATDIYGILIGRALQGAGAIAAAIMALVADLTQEVHRTKAMATIGASIGISFGIAITIGPILVTYIGIHGIFWLTAILATLAIGVVLWIVPQPQHCKIHRDAELVPAQISQALTNPDLLRLDYGIFVLHFILTASFVVLPILIRDAGLAATDHWQIYLPVLILSMAIIIPFIILAEKKRKMKAVFLGAISTLIIATLGLAFLHQQLFYLILMLGIFFCGFNLLEATLPSLISKTAPSDLKGTAMGAYSSSQFLGAFFGGLIGGGLYGLYGAGSVFIASAILASTWFIIAGFMQTPKHLANLMISLHNIQPEQAEQFSQQVLAINGIAEIRLHFAETEAYLKVDNQVLNKAELQTLLNHWDNIGT